MRITLLCLALTVALAGCTYESSGTTTTAATAPTDDVTRGPADLVMLNQATDGNSVVIRSITLPGPGFVAVYRDDDGSPGDRLGSSDRLQRGITANVTIALDEVLTEQTRLIAMVHVDADRNGVFTYEPPDDLVDVPALFGNGEIAMDDAVIRILPPLSPADIVVTPVVIDGRTIVVDRIVLPAAGFVSIRTDLDGEPDELIGVSELIGPGEWTDVVVEIAEPRRVSQTLWLSVHIDRDEDGEFDFGPAGGADVVGLTDIGEQTAVFARFEIVPVDPGSVEASDQESSTGGSVTVASASLPSHGFVLILAADGSVLGSTELIEAGTFEGITISLDPPLDVGEYELVAEVWIDFDDDGAFDPEQDRLAFDADGSSLAAASSPFTLTVPEPAPSTTTTTTTGG